MPREESIDPIVKHPKYKGPLTAEIAMRMTDREVERLVLSKEWGTLKADSFLALLSVDQNLRLRSNQSGSTTWLFPKTAALFYDKIWADALVTDPYIPKDLLFKSGLEQNWFRFFFREGDKTPVRDIILKDTSGYHNKMLDKCVALQRRFRKPLMPILPDETASYTTRKIEDSNALLFGLQEVPYIDEKSLTWEHVIEVRKDPDFRKKALDFLLYFKTIEGLGKDQITEEVECRLSGYSKKIKEHGLSVKLSALALVYSLTNLTPEIENLLGFIGSSLITVRSVYLDILSQRESQLEYEELKLIWLLKKRESFFCKDYEKSSILI